ncbi:MAG: acyl-CoA reductase [Kineosporiaceae bacterium]
MSALTQAGPGPALEPAPAPTAGAPTRVIDVPLVVCGRVREVGEVAPEDVIEVPYSGGVVVRMPRLTEADVDAVCAHRELLHDVPLGEVTRYLSAVGPRWMDADDPGMARTVDEVAAVTGYSRPMIERDYRIIGDYLTFRNNFYDLLDAELGDHRVTEEWKRNQVSLVRAYPRGRALHVLVGNVPMAGVYSVVRSVLTRNQTIAKLPARDLVTTSAFARALIEANPAGHPLSRSLTVAYWRRDDPLYDRLLHASDLVCAWGAGASLGALKARVPHTVPYLEFGPKRSFSVVWADEIEPDAAALRLAHDISVYDQEACFSPQQVFVIGDHRALVEALCARLDQQAEFLPRGRSTADVDSHVLRARLTGRYRGWEVREGRDWTVMVSDDGSTLLDHPLNRTVVVHPIADVGEVVGAVDDETQTVAVLPHARAVTVADVVAPRGAVRICEGGLVSHFRQGFTHDGGYPLRQFVRLVSVDESAEYVHKYGPPMPVEVLETFLFGDSADRCTNGGSR